MITGLQYLKDGTDPVAMKDEDYPPWLWDCLDVMKKASEEDGLDDEFCRLPSLRARSTELVLIPIQQSQRRSARPPCARSEPWKPSSWPKAT